MGILLRKCLLLFVILCPVVIFPGASGVEQRDYEEALKEDEPAESLQQSERSTEYPNGVNVIPGSADTHYPIYDKIPKSAFSCHGRIPGFYADPELRCQVWHICDESGVQQSFLCTNGTIYSQDKRVCDWWYNVNCDPEEVARNYAANSELYKGPPPKEGAAYEEATSNDLPPPPPTSHKKPVQQHQPQQQQQRPQNYEQRQPQHQSSPRPQQHSQQSHRQNYEQPAQRPQNQNYNNSPPQQTRDQQQDEEERASALKILEAYEQQSQSQPQTQQQSSRPQNQNSQNRPQQNSQQQRDQEQKRAEALKVIQNYERAQSQYRPQNYEVPQGRRQPTASQQNSNYVAPTPPTRPSHNNPPPPPPPNGSPVPEKKRVIVLRLPGPLPPGATIPPHILMEYAESVLAAERAGKAPPPGLVSSKTVSIPQNQQPQQPHQNHHQHQHRPQQSQPQHQNQQHQHRPQQGHQQQQQSRPQQQPAPTQPPQNEAQSSPAPVQRVRPSPKGPTLPYTPRPFSAFLEAAVKHNGQSKNNAAATPVHQEQPRQPQPQQQQHRPQPTPQQQQHRPQQSQNQQQQRRYEEPRQTPAPQSYEQQQPQQRRPSQQHQPSYQQPEEPSVSEEQSRQQQQPVPPKKVPVQHKPSKSGPPPSAVDSKKFRHSTPRKHGEIKFASRSSVNFDDLEDHIEESRRPAYFNNLAPVPHLAQEFYSTARPVAHAHAQQTYSTQPPKGDVHLKSSFDEVEKVPTRTHRVKQGQYQEPARTTTTTTERYLTAEEIHEPAIKRLVVAAGLKIKDPRNRQLTTPSPSASHSESEETYTRDRNYEPVRVIVARKSTTTETYPTPTTTTTTSRAPQQQYQHIQRNHHQRHHQPISQAPTTAEPRVSEPVENVTPAAPVPRVRPTPKGPTLFYTPRPFSAFLEAAVKYNGQSKGTSTPPPAPVAELDPQVYEETTPRPVTRRVIRKKIKVNHHNNNANLENTAQLNNGQPEVYEAQNFQKIPKTTTYAPVQTTRKPTTRTSTTPYYQPEDYYEPNDHSSTKATKNFGFDVYGRNEDEDEDEELVRAAQEYYQFSENYGKKQRY